jgi:hypothetical protein
MSALDYDSQIDSLVEHGHLDEAISLIAMLEDALLTDKAGRLRQVKLQKAQALFNLRKYRDSLDLFAEVSAPPEVVIQLYPRIISGDTSSYEDSDNEEADEAGEDATQKGSPDAKVGTSEPPTPEDKAKGKELGYAQSVRSYLRTRADDASETGSVRGKPSDVKMKDNKDKRLRGFGCISDLSRFLC